MKLFFVLLIITILPICANGQTEIKIRSLGEAIEIGLSNNPELKSAFENISVSKGKFWSAISLPQPELGASFEYAPVNKSLSDFSERTISISQSFEFPTNYFLKGNNYLKEEEISLLKYNQIKWSIISKIKLAYYKIFAKKELLKNSEENLSICDDFYKKANIKYNVGEGSNIERLTAKVQSSEAKNIFETSKNDLQIAFAELKYILGFGSENKEIKFELSDSLIFHNTELSLDDIYKLVEENNPKIKIAQLNQQISSTNKLLAWSSLLPNFNLSYFKQSRDGNDGFYGASFGISIPLWFMFDQRGKIQEAIAIQNVAEADFHSVKNEIILKINNDFTEYQNNLKQVNFYLNEIMPQVEEIYRSASKSYDAGELTYLEYLQAKQTLINSKGNFINTVFNYYVSFFNLEEIVGKNLSE